MEVRIAVLVVVDPIGNHSLGREIITDEFAHQCDVLGPRQLFRQRDDQLARQPRVCQFLESFNSVPQRFTGTSDRTPLNRRPQPIRRLIRQDQFLVHQLGGAAPIAERRAGQFVHHPSAMTIGGGRDDVASRAPADHLRSDEHDRHDCPRIFGCTNERNRSFTIVRPSD